ncbi:MAG: hypothetical protein ACTMIR_12365 [Cellulomonadaceae bacterium]
MPARPLLRPLLAGAVVAVLGACGTPPWEQESPSLPGSPSPTVTSTEPGTASPSATPTEIVQVVNDLASGSAARTLTAGAAQLDVTYWSDLDMGAWTADAVKPVSLSVSASIADELPVYLARLHVSTTVRDAQGTPLPAPADFVDDASVQPGYAMQDPYSYATTVNLPVLDEQAASVELTFTYEVLIATTPTADSYAKQSATDTLTVAIAPTAG